MFLDISWPGKSFTLSGLKAACPPGPGKVTDSEKHCPGSTCSQNKLLTVNKVDSTSKGQYFCGQREQNKHGFKVEVVRLKHLVKADQNPCLFQQEVSSENTQDSWQSLKHRNLYTTASYSVSAQYRITVPRYKHSQWREKRKSSMLWTNFILETRGTNFQKARCFCLP